MRFKLPLILLLFPVVAFAINKEEYEQFKQTINASHPRSYFAPGNFGNVDNLIFEGRVSDHFFVNFRRNANWAADADINITLRMLDQKSVPIYTPSYNPGINIYHFSTPKFLNEENFINAIGFYHYSNGQNGKFYNEDGSINYESGNFSTNYISFKNYSLFRDPKRDFVKAVFGSNLKVYLGTYPRMQPLFPKASLNLSYETLITNLRKGFNIFYNKNNDVYDEESFTLYRLKINFGFLFGYMRDTDFEDRFTVEITESFKPKWLDDFSFFFKYYYGRDYYNIHFTEKISQLSVGIMADNFIFRSDK